MGTGSLFFQAGKASKGPVDRNHFVTYSEHVREIYQFDAIMNGSLAVGRPLDGLVVVGCKARLGLKDDGGERIRPLNEHSLLCILFE